MISTGQGRRETAVGFTSTDLLLTLGALALLALLQLPAFAYNREDSHRAVCAENLRRLTLSWLMYADDNGGRLAPNFSSGLTSLTNNWVAGILDYSIRSDNTNPATITQARLYPYNQATEIYRCPADLSAVQGQLRIRSYSMNGWLGTGASGWNVMPSSFQIPTRLDSVRQPDRTFVFIEEHPDSINDGLFVMDMLNTGTKARIIDFPAAYHYVGANLGFGDGSVQYREWLDARTTPPMRFGSGPGLVLDVSSAGNPDIQWLQDRTTYRK
ncbi:MAG TPA: hypothetical protein VLU94_01585 [Candidatus Nitrosotalea sp.]|nr:hypothetical protein [Candidatus Nitrosotalea sp.]